jgi:hypothetical protein
VPAEKEAVPFNKHPDFIPKVSICGLKAIRVSGFSALGRRLQGLVEPIRSTLVLAATCPLAGPPIGTLPRKRFALSTVSACGPRSISVTSEKYFTGSSFATGGASPLSTMHGAFSFGKYKRKWGVH